MGGKSLKGWGGDERRGIAPGNGRGRLQGKGRGRVIERLWSGWWDGRREGSQSVENSMGRLVQTDKREGT